MEVGYCSLSWYRFTRLSSFVALPVASQGVQASLVTFVMLECLWGLPALREEAWLFGWITVPIIGWLGLYIEGSVPLTQSGLGWQGMMGIQKMRTESSC